MANPRLEKKTVNFVALIVFGAMLFDGYDLVVYSVVLPRLLADPTQIDVLDPAMACIVGSYALSRVLAGTRIPRPEICSLRPLRSVGFGQTLARQ